MKKQPAFPIQIIMITLLLSLVSLTAMAQERGSDEPRQSPNATVSQTIGTTEVSISYGRPAVQGRAIFGDLVPFDQIWRTGANEATTITFSDDVMVEGQSLNEGTYGLFTIPGEDQWTIVFNNVATQWGAFDYDSEEDALRVEVEPEEAHPVELMMFYFEEITENSGTIVLHWDDTKVPFTVEVQ